MKIRGVLGTAAIVWALALGTPARAHSFGASRPAPPPSPQASKPAAPPPAPKNEDCLTCHEDPSMKRENGTPVHVDKDAFAASVHGPMNCVDCHADLAHAAEFPHQATLAKASLST